MKAIAYIVIRVCVFFSRLPIRWHYAVSDVIYWLIIHLPRNITIRQRIEQAFPEKGDAWWEETEKKYYRCATNFSAEFIKYLTWSKEEIAQRMTYLNLDLLERLLEEHHYVVCYSGHFVNYELFAGLPLWLNGYGMCNFYDDGIRDFPYLDKWLRELRGRCGALSIPISSPLHDILRLYNTVEKGDSDLKGFVIGSLLDTRKSSPNQPNALIMGQEMPLHYGTERIGRRIGAAFVYAHISCPSRGQYAVTLKELHPNSKGSYMDSYIRELEENIRQQPELWMMWV